MLLLDSNMALTDAFFGTSPNSSAVWVCQFSSDRALPSLLLFRFAREATSYHLMGEVDWRV